MWAVVMALLAAEMLELRGRLDPPLQQAFVMLSSTSAPFAVHAVTDAGGRFRLRDLAPGSYTLAVLAPGRGEVRRTIHLRAASADARGRVEMVVPFDPPAATVAEGQTVSAETLRIPDRALREYRQAQQKLVSRDIEGAVSHLKRAVELAPRFAAAWNQLGTIAYQLGQREEAEKYFREALRVEPGAYTPLVNLGGVLVNLGRYQEALELNLRAVREQPEDALARVQLGATYWALGERDKAVEQLREAKRLDPEHFSQPELLLAQIYLERGERAAAVAELEEFLARRPFSPEAARVREQLRQLRGEKPAGK